MSTIYKRPIVRPRILITNSHTRISPLSHGFASDICRVMNIPAATSYIPPEWTPPRDHASYFAALNARGENTEKYEKMTEDFYRKYPLSVPKPGMNLAPVLALANKYYGKGEPPLAELSATMQACGVSATDTLSYTMGANKFEEFEYINYIKEALSKKAVSPYDYTPMCELHDRYYSKGKVPPVPAVTRSMRKAGYSEEHIDRYVKWNKRMEDTYEERTKSLDKIFARWPSASKGPVKKKVIKAVKKNP